MKKLIVLTLTVVGIVTFCVVKFQPSQAESSDLTASGNASRGPEELRPIPALVEAHRTGGALFNSRDLFAQGAKADFGGLNGGGVKLELDRTSATQFIKDAPPSVTLRLPNGDGGSTEVEVVRAEIFDAGFSVKTSAPAAVPTQEDLGVHYRGIVKGNSRSLVAISVFKNELAGYVSTEEGTSVIGRVTGSTSGGDHIFYNERDLKARSPFACNVKDDDTVEEPLDLSTDAEAVDSPAANCVRIYIEANTDIFTNKGSVAAAAAYVTTLFNQSATLYANESVPMTLSEVFVWNTASPYTGADSLAQLNLFRTTRTTFNGNLAHLLSLQSNYGGIAYRPGLCNGSFGYAFSGIHASFASIPTYSWSVNVFVHETGHNMASHHTHACQWNGNATAIDSCGPAAGVPYEGACSGAPLPPANGGTQMSYCHLNQGVSFALGFGLQPGNVIRNRFATGACLTDCGSPAARRQFDFDGDAKTDLSIFRPSVGQWWINRSSNGSTAAFTFGVNTDRITPADFTGDGKTDVAFFRPSTGSWFVLRSEDSSFYSFPFGANGDVPVPADFDADGKADAAVFRPSTLTWFISKSTGGTDIIGFGSAGDVPVVADYDGDSRADIAIYRPGAAGGGQWWVRRSSNSTVFASAFGTSTDRTVVGDYTGDGKADIAIWRPANGNWFILRSEDFSFFSFPFGANGDTPVPGDYDGDGRNDAAVFRPSTNTWFANRATGGTLIQAFGSTGDIPLPSAYVR